MSSFGKDKSFQIWKIELTAKNNAIVVLKRKWEKRKAEVRWKSEGTLLDENHIKMKHEDDIKMKHEDNIKTYGVFCYYSVAAKMRKH